MSNWQIYQFVTATECISEGFIKSMFEIILLFLQETKLTRINPPLLITDILRQI